MSQQFPPQYSGNQPSYSPQQPPQGYMPQQPMYQQPPRKRRTGLWIALVIGVVVVIALCGIIGAAAMSGASKNTTSTTNTNNFSTGSSSSTSSNSTAANHKPSELVNVDDTWDVTVNKVSTSAGDGQMNVPKAGNIFLLIDVTERNISSDQQNASGLVQYTLRGTDGTKYDQRITLGTDPGGAVSVGQTIKGKLAYEIPKSVKQFTLAFQSDLGSTQVLWDINR